MLLVVLAKDVVDDVVQVEPMVLHEQVLLQVQLMIPKNSYSPHLDFP